MFKFYLVADAKNPNSTDKESRFNNRKKNDSRNSFLPHDQEYNEILKNHFENPKAMRLIGKLTFTDED